MSLYNSEIKRELICVPKHSCPTPCPSMHHNLVPQHPTHVPRPPDHTGADFIKRRRWLLRINVHLPYRLATSPIKCFTSVNEHWPRSTCCDVIFPTPWIFCHGLKFFHCFTDFLCYMRFYCVSTTESSMPFDQIVVAPADNVQFIADDVCSMSRPWCGSLSVFTVCKMSWFSVSRQNVATTMPSLCS